MTYKWDFDKGDLESNLEKVKAEITKTRRRLSELSPMALKKRKYNWSFCSPEVVERNRERETEGLKALNKLKDEYQRAIDKKSITKL